MNVSRRDLYHKELTVAMSRSYGPGRYDPSYEEAGIDYPVGHVRWTERRNMEAFLDFLAAGSVEVSALLEQRYRVDDGERAYSELLSGQAYTAILAYPENQETKNSEPARVPVSTQQRSRLRVGCIGAGGFARTHILPNLNGIDGVSLESVATASGVSAESARQNFGFQRTQTPAELLNDPELNAVFITSRHQSHAGYVATALGRGKAVFVEKPLAVDGGQLDLIRQAHNDAGRNGIAPFLMVGFNRRFAPATEAIRHFFLKRQEPMLVHARINAGFIAPSHWTQLDTEGGRIIGEFCHFVDWARSVVGCPIRTVSATALPDSGRYNRDNVAATLAFTDGSIANLLYLANGDPGVPKEYLRSSAKEPLPVLRILNYCNLRGTGKPSGRNQLATRDTSVRSSLPCKP